MDSSVPEDSLPPRGYLSEKAKRRFTFAAGILGFVFFLGQTLLPVAAFFILVPRFYRWETLRVRSARPEGAVCWEGALWYVEESLPAQSFPKREATLQKYVPGSPREPESVAPVFMEDPRLLAGCETLWIISPEDVRYFKAGRLTVINLNQRLGNISNPFLVDGKPAVLEERPGRLALLVLRDRWWQTEAIFRLGLEDEDSSVTPYIRVVESRGVPHLFFQFGETLFHRKGLPASGEMNPQSWESVCTASGAWTATSVDGSPSVFYVLREDFRHWLVGLKETDVGWKRFFRINLGQQIDEFGVCDPGGEKLVIILQPAPGRLRFLEASDGRVLGETKHGAGVPFTRLVARSFVSLYACLLATPLVLAIVLSALMNRFRVSEYSVGQAKVVLASISRRAIAEAVDALILGGPLIVNYSLIYGALQSDFEALGPMELMGLIAAALAWVVLGIVVFSFLEGKWGRTPGKWMTGIRVLGTDLLPCGFVRGLVRNLLKVVDGFFNFLVGILVTALSENWQRVGDMAARTIVVRDRRRGLAPAPPGSGGVPPTPGS